MSIDLFTVYSYGGGDALFYVFNAVSMLFQSSLITSLINLSLALGLLWAGVKSAIERDHHRPYVRWFMTYLFITIVLIPHNGGMTLHIRDTIAGPAKKVDHLPPGLVIPAAFISNIGYTLTKNFETVFSMPDKNYLSYHEYGTMFGAEVMSELENFRVQDPVLRENLESYINNCIMYDVMIGHSYDIADLKNSQNILELIENNASSIRMFNYRLSDKKGRILKTCKAGIAEIASSLNNEHSALSLKFPFLSAERTLGTSSANDASTSSTSSTTTSSPQVNTGILNALSATLGFYGNIQSAESQLKQIFLINAFKLKPNSYGTVRAAQNQNTAWKLSGEMAKQTLPIIHALFQALIYATFPIIICLMFFPGGFRALLSYFGMMIWIELWPILFAILNLIVSAFASRYPIDITIQNLDSIVSSQSNYALAAASLGMLVPVLSYMIVKGGAGQFVHIAGSLTGATMQGVNLATQEVTSGNRSLDNISMGNKSQNIVSANKFDTSSYIDTTGHIKEKLPGGEFQTDLNDKRIYQGEGASSTGKTSIELGETTKDIAQKAYQEEMGKAEVLSKEYAKTVQSFDRKTVDFLSTIAEGRANGKNYSIDTSTESGKSLINILDKAHELHEKHDYSWQQAIEGALEIGVGGGKGGSGGISLGISFAGIGLTLGVSGGLNVGASAKATATKFDTQNVGENDSVIDDKKIEDHQALVKKWTESVNLSEADTEETRLVDSINKTFEVAKSQRTNLTETLSRASHAQDSITKSNEQSAGHTTNKYDDVLNYIADRPDPKLPSVKIGHKKARDIIESGGEKLSQYITDYKNSLYPNNHILENKHAALAKQTNFNVEDTKHELQPEDTTAQFKADQREKHFKNFNVDGTDIKNEIQNQHTKTTQDIAEQEAAVKKEELRLRKEVDKADHSKSVIGRAFAKENPNVSPDDSQWPGLVDLGLSALSLTPLGAGGRGMKVVNKLLPGVGKQVIKKLPGLSKKLPGLSNFKKLPKPKK